MFDSTLLATAAFFASALDSIADGGRFLTLPALVYMAVPIILANVTSSVSVSPLFH